MLNSFNKKSLLMQKFYKRHKHSDNNIRNKEVEKN